MSSESFSGPSCKDLVEFMKSVKSMPSKYKSAFDSISEQTIDTICDPDALHIWESDSDLDNLLQLTQVIVKLRSLASSTTQNGKKSKGAAMVIIAEEKKERDNYDRITQLIRYLTGLDGKKHLNSTVTAFDAIVVVRGIDPSSDQSTPNDGSAAVKRINIAIERVLAMSHSSSSRKLIWHHGPILSLLLTWINTTTPTLRTALAGITITAALDFTSGGVQPSPLGRANKLPDLQRLQEYATKLDIPVLFLDPGAQLVVYEYLSTYMYFWAYYIGTFLPLELSRMHLYKALDELVTFAFRLRGASEGTYGADVVRMVQKHLDAGTAKRWARHCIDANSYSKARCRDAAKDAAIHHAVQLADSPFALFNHIPGYGVPAFSRLAICPTTPSSSSSSSLPNGAESTSISESYIAAPLSLNPKSSTFALTSNTPLRILLPRPGQTLDKVTARIQGTMMGVLERLRQEKGVPPRPRDADREVWREVGKACKWAIEGCEGRLPEGVGEKVKFVGEKVEGGTYGYAVGLAGVKKGTIGARGGGGGGGGMWG